MHPYFELPTPHLFGHRGASGEAPENTLLAFQRAVEAGVPYLEMDCHATSDGEVVVCHDPDVARTTDGNGLIREQRLAELSRLDAGYRFSPDGVSFPFRNTGVRIPRLAEVLETFREVRINLEVKQEDPPIAEEVVRLVQQAGATERTLLAAAEDPVMESIRKLNPGTALSSSRGDALTFYAALDSGKLEGFQPRGHALQIPPSFGGRSLVTPESVVAAHRVGLRIHVWTINDPEQMRHLLDQGVDGLMSDFPARLVRIAREHEAAR